MDDSLTPRLAPTEQLRSGAVVLESHLPPEARQSPFAGVKNSFELMRHRHGVRNTTETAERQAIFDAVADNRYLWCRAKRGAMSPKV
jgi:hypothetical protein